MKNKIFTRALWTIFSVVNLTGAYAQGLLDANYNNSVQGIQLYTVGNRYTYPVMKLGDLQSLQLSFDDLDNSSKNYYYTFQLCDADWRPVSLSYFDYLKGLTQVRIAQYKYSSYAKTKYLHYEALLPQSNCIPVHSGNYLLKVFLDGDTSQLVFTRRLLVVDNKVAVTALVQHPFNGKTESTSQKVQFNIDVSRLQVSNPLQQIKVVVLQNYRWDNAKTGLQPAFMRGNIYEYNGERDVVFPGGKEYRWIDLRSFRFQSERIKSVDMNQLPYLVDIVADKSRVNEPYIPFADHDGFFGVEASEQINADWQGDYARVHFSFVTDNGKPFPNKELYIVGQLDHYAYDDESRLKFNPAKGTYETTLLLKQGYYDYMYVTKDENELNPVSDNSLTEGDYWETENQYTILVYYQSFTDRAPQLVACSTVNSRDMHD